uniref:Oxidored_nitro domain-containing protein n=1 Tax=Parastrongyloides trichosuri TaxID=131310 RepID=A0A0N4ZTV7_PARTI
MLSRIQIDQLSAYGRARGPCAVAAIAAITKENHEILMFPEPCSERTRGMNIIQYWSTETLDEIPASEHELDKLEGFGVSQALVGILRPSKDGKHVRTFGITLPIIVQNRGAKRTIQDYGEMAKAMKNLKFLEVQEPMLPTYFDRMVIEEILRYHDDLVVIIRGKKEYTEVISTMPRVHFQMEVIEEEVDLKLPTSEGCTIFTTLGEEYGAATYLHIETLHPFRGVMLSHLRAVINQEKKTRGGWRAPRLEEAMDIFEYVRDASDRERKEAADALRRARQERDEFCLRRY